MSIDPLLVRLKDKEVKMILFIVSSSFKRYSISRRKYKQYTPKPRITLERTRLKLCSGMTWYCTEELYRSVFFLFVFSNLSLNILPIYLSFLTIMKKKRIEEKQ